jgi:(S)-ureidoglycine aminohydrolase
MSHFHGLGHTRSVLRRDHLLQTPDTFIRAPLPGMRKATAVVHAGPAVGAGFVEYTAEMEAGGELGPSVGQRFCYVIEGGVDGLETGGYGYFSDPCPIVARIASKVLVIERAGESDCRTFRGKAGDVAGVALGGDSGVQVQVLLADELNLNFAVNLMTFQPGAALSLVEMHVMEHGLMMLEGGGIYRLSDCWYPVSAGDFIWMAPFCPQWFTAVGKTPAKYIIYKDWNRHPGV